MAPVFAVQQQSAASAESVVASAVAAARAYLASRSSFFFASSVVLAGASFDFLAYAAFTTFFGVLVALSLGGAVPLLPAETDCISWTICVSTLTFSRGSSTSARRLSFSTISFAFSFHSHAHSVWSLPPLRFGAGWKQLLFGLPNQNTASLDSGVEFSFFRLLTCSGGLRFPMVRSFCQRLSIRAALPSFSFSDVASAHLSAGLPGTLSPSDNWPPPDGQL